MILNKKISVLFSFPYILVAFVYALTHARVNRFDKKYFLMGRLDKGRATRDTTGFVLYGTGVIDVDNLAEYRKRAQKDKSILGQRKIEHLETLRKLFSYLAHI